MLVPGIEGPRQQDVLHDVSEPNGTKCGMTIEDFARSFLSKSFWISNCGTEMGLGEWEKEPADRRIGVMEVTSNKMLANTQLSIDDWQKKVLILATMQSKEDTTRYNFSTCSYPQTRRRFSDTSSHSSPFRVRLRCQNCFIQIEDAPSIRGRLNSTARKVL